MATSILIPGASPAPCLGLALAAGGALWGVLGLALALLLS